MQNIDPTCFDISCYDQETDWSALMEEGVVAMFLQQLSGKDNDLTAVLALSVRILQKLVILISIVYIISVRI